MKFYELSHNSPEWFAARLGVATTSKFDNLITPNGTIAFSKKGTPAEKIDKYSNELIAEIVTREGMETFPQSYWMERGSLLEDEASEIYQLKVGIELDRGGFFTTDDGVFGASPDRRVGEPGLVEIKVPKPSTHVTNLIRMSKNEIDPKYKPQVQGQLLISGREWVDWFSYNPEMPPAHIRTYRDEKFIASLEDAFKYFRDMMDDKFEALRKIGIDTTRPIIDMPRDGLQEILDTDTAFFVAP